MSKKINTFLKKLPENEQKKYESGEEKKRRKRLREVREVMWKKTRQEGENLQSGEIEDNLEKLETELTEVEDLVKRYEEEKIIRLEKKENLERGEREKGKREKRNWRKRDNSKNTGI